MRTLIAAAAAFALLGSAAASTAAFAQAPAASMSGAKYTIETPIEKIAADPAAKAILDKDLPGLTTHEAYDSFKSMSLKDVQPMSNGAITDAALAKVSADLAAVK